jgi:phage-related protein
MHKIKYYQEEKSIPVLEFMEQLPPKVIAKLLRNIDLLENNGFNLGFPFISRITGTNELWELRTKLGHNNYRIIFFHYRNGLFVLLHAFIKKLQKYQKKK